VLAFLDGFLPSQHREQVEKWRASLSSAMEEGISPATMLNEILVWATKA